MNRRRTRYNLREQFHARFIFEPLPWSLTSPGERRWCAGSVSLWVSHCSQAGRPGGPAQEAAQLPTGVTAADTAAGDSLFHALGGCQSCHGEGGVGTDQGPGFREGRWKLGDGSYQWLVHITRHGGYGIRNRGDEPMPMRGPTVLDSAQVRRVAAYVWAISRARRPARPVAAPSN